MRRVRRRRKSWPTRANFWLGSRRRAWRDAESIFPGWAAARSTRIWRRRQIRRTWQQLWQEDLEPYRALRDELPMVMVSHAAYPLTKDEERPASVSSFWVSEVLRKRIGYRGIVLSDDLEMGGVANFMPMGEAAVEAVRVGSDLLLICHHPEPIHERV